MKDNLWIYILVFMAILLPVALWKRDDGAYGEKRPQPGWENLPSAFKALWAPICLLETSVGTALAAALPGKARRYREFVDASGLPLNPARVFACQVVLMPFFAAFGALAFACQFIPPLYAWLFVGFTTWVGWALPSNMLESFAQRRREEITKQLPFAIDLMGSAMRAGLEFGAAMRYFTGLKSGGALEAEFSRVLQDVSLGKPFAESLQDMADRLRIKAFTAFVGVVSYGMEIGASISATLKLHGAELRRERFNLAERKAARAPSLMIFPLAIFIMPAVFLIIFVPVFMQFQSTKSMK